MNIIEVEILGAGQGEIENSSFAWLSLGPDAPTMTVDDALDGC